MVEPSARIEAVSVWQNVLDLLREECNDNFGLTIFDTVEYEGFFDGCVQIIAPDDLRENWIRSHYGEILDKTLSRVLGPEYAGFRIRIAEPKKMAMLPEASPVSPVIPRPVKRIQTQKVIRRKLSLYAGYTFENFIEGDCNFTACEACKSVAENPGDPALNPLFVYGKSGLGKTHLLQSIAAQVQKSSKGRSHIVYCHAYDFLRDATAVSKALNLKTGNVRELAEEFQEKYENCDILLLDDVQLLEHAAATQRRLAILIKHLRAVGKQVVLSCDRHPSQFNRLEPGERKPAGQASIPCISAELLAPLESCVAVGLAEPDLSTRMKLIQRKSVNIPFVDKDREEICRFLSIPRRENVRVIEGMLNGLSAMNQFCQESLDLGAVKRLVSAPGAGARELTSTGIAQVVALEFNTDMLALTSKRQDAGVSLPRKVAMYLCREMTTDSHEKIGMLFNRDYSSVIAAVRSLVKQMDKDGDLARKVQDIRYLLEA